jgi:hypothetical protein
LALGDKLFWPEPKLPAFPRLEDLIIPGKPR